MRYKTVAIVLFVIFAVLLLVHFASYLAYVDNDVSSEKTLHSKTRSLMDTIVTISVVSSNETDASESIDRAFEKMYHINDMMNIHDENSEISLLNSKGDLYDADPELVYVIQRSGYHYEQSGGAFDISIKPLLDLWASKYSPGGPYTDPTTEEINESLMLVNYSYIDIQGNDIRLDDGMGLTLGGVAKGYAVDKAVESLVSDGINSGFVNAGGDGRYFGIKPDGTYWTVGLQDPEKSSDHVVMMDVRDMAVATSGNYERYFNESARISHIADPRTGYPSQTLISATVLANNAMDADAFSTAVFVLGETDGMEMIEVLPGVECLIITEDKRILRSSGFHIYEIN